jgi:hypothetical protein
MTEFWWHPALVLILGGALCRWCRPDSRRGFLVG